MTNEKESRRLGRWTLVGLCALFFGPVVLAVAWYNLAPQLAPAPHVQGELIDPARPLEPFSVATADEPALTLDDLRGRWHLVQFVGGACDSTCRARLHATRQVRSALGKDRLRLNRIAVADHGAATVGLADVLEDHPGLRVVGGAASSFARQFPAPRDAASVFVVDPFGNLMLRFGADTPPEAMLDDLEQLLKLSRIG